MREDHFSVKTVVAVGIGAAVFFILARFVSIPVGFIPNVTIQTSYAFLALAAILFGPIAGALIAFIGHTLTDLTAYGNPWWSWIICSAILGLLIGIIGKRITLTASTWNKKGMLYFTIFQLIAQFIVWGLVAPILDVLIYSEPASKVFTQGIVSAISNSVTVAILGNLLISAYAKTRTEKGSLKIDV
ncbi:MAG: ECF-type riboflavin transporter substrate-binding protein [Bacillus sp. (in: firmicutes)]